MTRKRHGFSCVLLAMSVSAFSGDIAIGEPDDAAIKQLEEYVFPRTIEAEAESRAFEFRDEGYPFKSLEAVKQFNLRSADPIPRSKHMMLLSFRPMESPHRATLREGRAADYFINRLSVILSQDKDVPVSRRPRWTVLQKLIRQRDLYQILSLVVIAREYASTPLAETANQLIGRLAKMIAPTLMDAREYRQLLSALPVKLPQGYRATLSYSLTDNYLPPPVLGTDTSWLLLTNRGRPFRHFVDYRARSFVKVYLRSNDASIADLAEIRRELYGKYGDIMHMGAVNEPLPKGLETMLIRTIGVFLVDGTFRDSFWPEEVLIRAFKYPTVTFDNTTSDFSGTLFYQYKLSREQLKRDPASLGLYRIMDDDPQFFGFFGDVPDPRNSYSNTTTTMRANCISCHAEVFYGFPTIFSLERDPDFEFQKDDNDLWEELGDGAYRLKTREFLQLAQYLHFDNRVRMHRLSNEASLRRPHAVDVRAPPLGQKE